jgi:predicted SprT family Zn-dependent metalloprotease
MDFPSVQALAHDLLRAHGLAHWSFGWNRRKRSLGLCRYREKRIELSAYFVAANPLPPIRETILHEIAHALAGEKAGHGPAWKAVCLRIGCKPERCDNGSAIMPGGRWQALCPACGKHYSRHRRPQKRARYWCRQCGPARGPVIFTQTHASAN